MAYNAANQMAMAIVSGTASAYGYDAFGQRLTVTTGTSGRDDRDNDWDQGKDKDGDKDCSHEHPGFPFFFPFWHHDADDHHDCDRQPPPHEHHHQPSGKTTLSVSQYGPDNEILSETDNNVETDYVWLDGMPVVAIQPAAATISYIHTDRLGTPQKATNASKSVVWLGNYQPFGAVSPAASITMNLRLPGMQADITGFYNNGLRHNDPALGRYLESDPIGLAGGLNTYVYAGNNPFKYTDRTGLFFGIDDAIELSLVASAWLEVNAPWAIPVGTGAARGIFGFYAEGGASANPAAATAETGAMCSAEADSLYHYTSEANAANILEGGLEPGIISGKIFTTTNGNLTPLQAQIELGLSPNRGLPEAVLEIDAAGLRNAGINPSLGPLRVQPTMTSPGGGDEVIFEQRIPPEFIQRK